jgi:hypothetical protein
MKKTEYCIVKTTTSNTTSLKNYKKSRVILTTNTQAQLIVFATTRVTNNIKTNSQTCALTVPDPPSVLPRA